MFRFGSFKFSSLLLSDELEDDSEDDSDELDSELSTSRAKPGLLFYSQICYSM